MASMAVQEVLECTICLDVPASPIHNCSNGHIICGICSEKVNKCGLCESQFEISVLAERLSRQLDFKSKCPNFDAGCHKSIASTEIKGHIPKCYYRNALCNEREHERCTNVSIPVHDFPRHLKEKHKCFESSSTNLYSMRRWVTLVHNKLPEKTTWAPVITMQSDQSFLLLSVVEKDSVYFWTTVLADKEEANKHMYQLILEKQLDGDKKMTCYWMLPVLPYHDHSAFKNDSPQFASIPATSLIEFCEKEAVEGNTKVTFKMFHRILSFDGNMRTVT